MNKLIRTGIIYIVPTILILFFMENHLLLVQNSYNKKKRLLENELSKIKVLVLGSSLPANGIDPSYFAVNGFNLANISQSLYYDYELISKYISGMPDLKLVIIGIDYFSLEYKLDENPEYWRSFFYERFFQIPLKSKKHRFDICRFSLIELYGGKRSLECAMKHFKVDLAPDVKDNGAQLPQNGKCSKDKIRGRVLFHHGIMHVKNIEKNMLYLNKMMQLLQSKSVIPVIVTSPLPREYSDYIDKTRYNKMQENVHSICVKYGAKYHNYMFDDRFISEDFADDHLSNIGSKKFSKIVNQEIIAPEMDQINDQKYSEKINTKNP